MANKEELRKTIKSRLAELSSDERVKYSNIIVDKLLALDEYKSSQNIFVYNSFGSEVITDKLIGTIINNGKTVSLPRIKDTDMDAVIINEKTDYSVNELGISEPLGKMIMPKNKIELSIIPLLGFDRKGNRLGRGKGFYDKFLQGLICKKIALAYSVQEEKNIIVDDFDIKIDKIITEKEIIG